MSYSAREEQLRDALRKSAHIIQELEAELAAYHEPIAIIGMACRFPGGVDTPESYWQLLQAGREAIGELPAHRMQLPSRPGPGQQVRAKGGFLPEVETFDPAFSASRRARRS